MGFTDEQKKRILAAAGRLDAVEAGITSRVVNNANEAAAAKVNRQSAQIASRLDNPINSPSAQAKRSAQIARNLDNSLINKATTGTTNHAEMYRPGNVTESLFKIPNYISNNAMTEMVDRANARWALQQDNTATEKAREAAKKSAEQQKAAMERMVSDLYQKMEGYKNNGQTDELFKAEQEYAKLNDSIAQMNSKIHGSAMEEAKDWETQRYNEIMSTGGRVLMANLEQLVELSDRRISEADDERKNGLTETQKQYNELYKSLTDKYGSKVDGWLEYAKRAENKSQMAMRTVQAKNAAENHPFWASVGSVPLNLASGAGYMDVLGQKLQRSATGSDAPIDYNSPAQSASKMTNTIRGTVSEGMGGVGKFLYNTGMSMADSLVVMPMGNFGMALLGGSAATNAMQAAIERGASDDQALKIGILAGAIEAALEKTSIDSLFNLTDSKTVADFFTNAFKQSGAELTEEGLTKLGNTFADAVIMGNKSELNTAKRDYIADGYSPEKAEGMALKDWGVDLLLDMAGGALSGFLFGSFKSGFDVVRNGGFQKPTVESVMPKPKQETQAQPPVADITPTPQQEAAKPIQQQTETEVEELPMMPGYGEVQDDGILVYRGYNRSTDGKERNLARMRGIGDVLGRDIGPETELLPLVYYTDSMEDAEGYAKHDLSFFEMLKEKYGEEQALETYKTLTGRDEAKIGEVLEHRINPKKVMDLTELGEQTNTDAVYKLLSRELGIPERLPVSVRDQMDMDSYLEIGDPDGDSYPTYMLLKNKSGILSDDAGSRVLELLREFGYDAIKYKEDGANHYAVVSDDNQDAPKQENGQIGKIRPGRKVRAKDTGEYYTVTKDNGDGSVDLIGSYAWDTPTYKISDLEFYGYEWRNRKQEAKPASVDDVMPNLPGKGQDSKPAMGAADAGFSPYSAYQNTQSSFIPEGTNAARPVDVPSTDPTGKHTRRFLSNAMGAQAINENTDARLQSDFMEGKYGYDIKGDPEAVRNAQNTLQNSPYDRFYGETLERLQSMKNLKQTVVDAQLLALEAQRKGNDADAAEILLLLAETGTEFGQAVQAYSIFRKLTPEGQLEGVRRAVKRINEKAVKKGGKPKYSEADQTAIMDVVEDIRETVLQQMESVGAEQTNPAGKEQSAKPKPKKEDKSKAKKETEKKTDKKTQPKTAVEKVSEHERDHGLEVEKWIEEIGNEVARAVGAKPSAPGPKPISRIIKQDLLKFAKDYLPKKPQGQKRTAVDTLTDFFANRKQYVEAWNTAKQAYIAKHGSDTDFAGATITYNADGSDPVMVQAIVEEVVDSELKKRNIDIRSALGDQTALENQIADSLISDTGATGTDAAMIQDAVKRYFNETRLSANAKTVNNNIKSDINKNLKGIGKKMSDIIRTSPGDKAAVATRIANMMVKQYGISQEAAQTAAANIIDRFNNMVAERSQKTLESMFKPRDKKAKQTVMQRFSELANLGAFTDSNYRQVASERLFGEGVMVDEALAQKFLAAPDEAARADVMEEIYQDIGSKLPTTLGEIANQWRYTAMLLNPSTHAKNIIGSATQFSMSMVKDALAVPGEALANKISGGKTGRTKAYLNLKSEADQNLLNIAGQYYDAHRDDIMGESQYSNTPEGKINQYKTTMKLNNPQTKVAKAVDALLRGAGKAADWNTDVMDIEDAWFSRPRFQTALAGYMKANGLNEVTDEAYKYAKSEAQKATYRDMNAVSEWASKLGRKTDNPVGKIFRFVINADIPFKKSVANIGVRAVEYSPLGLIKTGTDIAKAAYRKDAGAVAGIINDLAANATGSLLYALGIAWAKDGLLRARGSEDDKEREQLKREGYKDNALYVGDVAIPIEFLGAVSIPLLLGASTYEAIARANNSEEGLTWQDYISIGARSLDPLDETTMLQGVRDATETFVGNNPQASLMEAITFGLMETVGNYYESFIPTALSRTAASLDKSARQSYVEPDSQFPELDKVMQGLQYKIPGARNQLVERVDAYGNTVSGGLPDTGNKLLDIMGAIGNAVTPTYPSKTKTTAVDEEMRRLYNVEGLDKDDRTVFISDAPKNFEVDGKDVRLTGDQYVKYQKTRNSSIQKMRDDIMSNDRYEDLPDDIKLRAMSDAANYANALAKAGLDVGYKIKTPWMNELAGASPEEVADAIITRSIENAAEGYEGGKYAGLGDMLDSGSIDDDLAIALLPSETHEKYMKYGKGVPAADLMDVLAYKNSDDVKVSDKKPQELVKAYLNDKYKGSANRKIKIGIWCTLYAESTCPW